MKNARFKRQEATLQQTLQNLQNAQQQQSQAQRRPGQGNFNQNGANQGIGGNQGQGFNNQGNQGGFSNTRPGPGRGTGSVFNQGFSNGQAANQNGFSNGGASFGTIQNGFSNGAGSFGTNEGALNNLGSGFSSNQGGLNNGRGNSALNNNQGGGQGWTTVRNTFNIPIDETNIPEAECVRRCPTLSNYNPVCGSDNITYTNEQRFRCAQQCGRRKFNGSNSIDITCRCKLFGM